MKFDMGSSTLSTLAQQTQGSSDDLGSLIQQLIAAAAPLEGKFNGSARAAFDSFKTRSDDITTELNSAANEPLIERPAINASSKVPFSRPGFSIIFYLFYTWDTEAFSCSRRYQ